MVRALRLLIAKCRTRFGGILSISGNLGAVVLEFPTGKGNGTRVKARRRKKKLTFWKLSETYFTTSTLPSKIQTLLVVLLTISIH